MLPSFCILHAPFPNILGILPLGYSGIPGNIGAFQQGRMSEFFDNAYGTPSKAYKVLFILLKLLYQRMLSSFSCYDLFSKAKPHFCSAQRIQPTERTFLHAESLTF